MHYRRLPDSPGVWACGQQQLTALWGGTSRQKSLPLLYLGPLLNASSQPTPVKKISSLFQPSRVFQALLCCKVRQLQNKLMQRVCQNRRPPAATTFELQQRWWEAPSSLRIIRCPGSRGGSALHHFRVTESPTTTRPAPLPASCRTRSIMLCRRSVRMNPSIQNRRGRELLIRRRPTQPAVAV
jgi:hypothetical protein